MDFSSYSMFSDHERLFHQITSIPDDQPLTDLIQEKYWEYKRCCDRCSIRVTEQDVARICTELGYGRDLQDKTDEDFTELYKSGKVPRETPVLVQWGQKQRAGVFKYLTSSGAVMVRLEGEGDERKFTPAKVKVAEFAGSC